MALHQTHQNLTTRLVYHEDDRRLAMRFPIEMDAIRRVEIKSGAWITGRTINISSSGILIRTESLPIPGCIVEAALAWPYLLDGRIPLQLIVRGRVVRSGGGRVAIALKRFEFRIARAIRGTA